MRDILLPLQLAMTQLSHDTARSMMYRGKETYENKVNQSKAFKI